MKSQQPTRSKPAKGSPTPTKLVDLEPIRCRSRAHLGRPAPIRGWAGGRSNVASKSIRRDAGRSLSLSRDAGAPEGGANVPNLQASMPTVCTLNELDAQHGPIGPNSAGAARKEGCRGDEDEVGEHAADVGVLEASIDDVGARASARQGPSRCGWRQFGGCFGWDGLLNPMASRSSKARHQTATGVALPNIQTLGWVAPRLKQGSPIGHQANFPDPPVAL